MRLAIFLTNSRFVQEHNAANKGFKLSLNHLSALTPSEYKSLLGFKRYGHRANSRKTSFSAPDQVDWREKGVVNKIQDQAQCGSCWAFSAIQSIESSYAIKSGVLPKLSEQNIVDCDSTSDGCDGGLMSLAFDYIIEVQNKAVEYEADYQYVAADGKCKFDPAKSLVVLNSYINITEGDESQLAEYVAQYGPAAVAIDASSILFQLYFGGIFEDPFCSTRNLDHGVGVVGYGTEGKKNFWIVRNSWGAVWGESGYIRMRKDHKNQCGIATTASVTIPV